MPGLCDALGTIDALMALDDPGASGPLCEAEGLEAEAAAAPWAGC
jgi:hypothetical protein